MVGRHPRRPHRHASSCPIAYRHATQRAGPVVRLVPHVLSAAPTSRSVPVASLRHDRERERHLSRMGPGNRGECMNSVGQAHFFLHQLVGTVHPTSTRRVDGTMAAMFRASGMPRLVKLTSALVCELLGLVAVFGRMRWLRTSPHSYAVAIGVACIIPLTTIAVFTAHRFWHDRRPPSAHGQHCGYNLTGNASGICSECGTNA